jgi:sec-independent protein translocase protein TatC
MEKKKKRSSLKKMSFLDHLDELRKRLFISIIAIAILFGICWFFSKPIYNFLAQPIYQFLPEDDQRLAFISLSEPFFLYLKVAFLAAIFFASPIILTQLWMFIAPGLYRKEKKYALPFIIFTTLFFVAGGLFGYYIAFPMVVRFFLKMGAEFRQVVTIHSYLSLLTNILLGLGLVFETPLIIFFLSRLGLVTTKFLIKNFKYAILIIFIIAAVITPTPDVVTQATFALPMIVLYALGILISLIFGKPREDKDWDEEEEEGEEKDKEEDFDEELMDDEDDLAG